jgi:hypothetical protein
MPDHIHGYLPKWELAGDAETLATLPTDDFGPLGFVLPWPAWMDRHRQGLAYEQFSFEEIQIRLYDDVAVVTARNLARGTYQGPPLPEGLQATLVIASNSEGVGPATAHMSFIAGTLGSPPVPGLTDSAESGTATSAVGRER